MKKRFLCSSIILVLLSIILSTFCSYTSFAASNDIISINDKEDVYIYDKDNLIDDKAEKELNLMLIDLEKKTSAEFAVISIPTLNNLTIEEYSYKLFNELGIGKKGKDNGVLLLFSKTDTKVRLEIGRGLEGCLNDGKCGRILDNYFVPYREENNYTDATKFTVNAVLSVIAEEYNVELNDVEHVDVPEESESKIPLWFIILLIILLVLLEIGVGGSSGGSGGYYRGGSSGGFSGGFGGGGSGAGGASR